MQDAKLQRTAMLASLYTKVKDSITKSDVIWSVGVEDKKK